MVRIAMLYFSDAIQECKKAKGLPETMGERQQGQEKKTVKGMEGKKQKVGEFINQEKVNI